jgi:hypothetical protein
MSNPNWSMNDLMFESIRLMLSATSAADSQVL